MTILERIKREKDNLTQIIAYKSGGLFLTMYEVSAFAFCSRIKQCKVNVKSLKGLPGPYVWIGVPAAKFMDIIIKDMTVMEETPEYITIILENPTDTEGYLRWREEASRSHEEQVRQKKLIGAKEMEAVQQSVNKPVAQIEHEDSGTEDVKACVREIIGLNMAAMTPMEAMNFLNRIHGRLRNSKT